MSISYDKFLDWVETRFSLEDIKHGKNGEVRLNSIFHPEKSDTKHRLWCSPSGGKHHRLQGVFHCFDTDEKGSLISLVMLVDSCAYQQALDTLDTTDTSLRVLERKVNDMFNDDKIIEAIVDPIENNDDIIKLPDHVYPFDELSDTNYHRIQAEVYLFGRRLKTQHLMVGTAGEFKNRIVIPYYDRNGKLIYFNSRYIGTSKKALRYMGPHKDVGVGKEDVLYVPKWPAKGSKIYLTEGEFDALSLTMAGFPSGAFGSKNLSERHVEFLVGYHPVICVDTDKTGKIVLPKIGDKMIALGINKISFVRPPIGFKDWNKMLEQLGHNVMRAYVENKEKQFNMDYMGWGKIELGMQDL